MAAILTRTAQRLNGHRFHGNGIARQDGVGPKVNGDQVQVNGHNTLDEEEGKNINWSVVNGQGMDENGLPEGPGRCFCCPYGYHIDREFLSSLVRSSELNDANLQKLRKMHQRKLRHRQTMESLLMQSIPSSSPTDFPHREPVTPTTSDATESDVSLTEESSTNRDETSASGILSELDETIAEALQAIDELMNSKSSHSNHQLNAMVVSPSDTGSISVVPVSPSSPSSPGSLVPFKSQPQLNPNDLATAVTVERNVRSGNSIIQDVRGKEVAEKEVIGAEIRTTARAKPPPLYPKPLINFRMGDKSHPDNKKFFSFDADPLLNNTPVHQSFPYTNEDATLVSDALKIRGRDCVAPTDESQAVRAVDDLSSSSDLTKALAVLLPIDGKGGGAGGTEGLVRLRQYIVSSLRQMRMLEQQVKTIPVMHVRLSVLKEEKKLLRLQLLSLQNSIPAVAADAPPKGCREDGVATPSNTALSPTLSDRLHRCSSGVGPVICSQCRGSITANRVTTNDTNSRETSSANSHPLEMSTFKDVLRFHQQQQPEGAERDDSRPSATVAEPRTKRQLCKSISLNPSLLFNRKINPTQRIPENISSENIAESSAPLTPNGSTVYRRLGAVGLKRGLSLTENAGTVSQHKPRGPQDKTASETNLVRNRWNAKSLEKIAGFRATSPGHEPAKAFFNEPVKIRKVSLAKNPYPRPAVAEPLPKQTPPQHRQSFNAGIQCELLSTKTSAAGATCPRCNSVKTLRKPISRDAPRVGSSEGNRATTINGESRGQTPDVIVTHRQASLSGGGLQETGERKENGITENGQRMDGQFSKSSFADAILKVESRVVGCVTDGDLNGRMKPETSACPDRTIFRSDSKEVGCSTDDPPLDAIIRETSTFTEMFVRDSKEVSCSADLSPNLVITRDASSLTDENLFKEGSKEVGCSTDVNLSQVVTCDASSLTDRELLQRSSKEVGCSTDFLLDKVVTRDASSFTDHELFKGNSKDVECLTDTLEVITCDASCLTENKLFKEYSKAVGCVTDSSLNPIVTLDASSLTERVMFQQNSKEIGCLTDISLSQLVTHDASSFTDKELIEGYSKEVGCLTDMSLNQAVTHNVSTFTDIELLKGGSKDISCLTDKSLSQVVTHDASSFTDEALFKEYSKEVGCLTDVSINDVTTQDASSLTEKPMFNEYSKDVGCLTVMTPTKLSTRDAFCFTDKELLKQDSNDVSCMREQGVIPTNDVSCMREQGVIPTNDVSCMTEQGVIPTNDVSCMTEQGVKPTNDASCNTELLSHCEQATQVPLPLQSNPTTSGDSLNFTKLDSSCQTGCFASTTTGQLNACNSDKLSKRNTHEVGCKTDFVLPSEEFCKLRRQSDSGLAKSLFDGATKAITEVNNNEDKVVAVENMNGRYENEPVVVVLSNDVDNSNIIRCPGLVENSRNLKIVTHPSSDLQEGHRQTTPGTTAESNARGVLVREKSKRVNLVLEGRSDADKRIDASEDVAKCTRPPSEKSASNDILSFHVGESLLSERLTIACQTYSTWLQDSTEVNSKQLNGSLKVIQEEWFSASSQKTSSSANVKRLIEAFAKFSPHIKKQVVNMADANENTALHYSVSHRNFDLILSLLSTGVCDVNRRNRAGCTAVMLASLVSMETDDQRATMRRLIEASDVNVTATLTGQTALMLAASRDHRDTVRMLLEAKADPNVQDLDGSTALMCASEHGFIAVVKILLSHPGCDPSLCDNEGSTALSVAMEAGHRDIGVLLYAHINFRKQTSQVVGRRHERKASASSYKRF